MALRDAWWMKTQPECPLPANYKFGQQQEEHKHWPCNQSSFGLGFSILDATLKNKPGSRCRIEQYKWNWENIPLKWVTGKTILHETSLVKTLQEPASENSIVYIATYWESEAIRALGQYLTIPLRFFDFSYTRLSIGNPVKQHLFFSLQFMDMYSDECSDDCLEKYPLKSLGKDPRKCPGKDHHVPSEARRSNTSPRHRFRAANGDLNPHVWYVTCVRVVFLRRPDGNTFRGLIELDPADDAVADGLNTLMTRDEDMELSPTGEHAVLGRLLSHIMYIVSFNWTVLLREAASNIQFLNKECVHGSLKPNKQLEYTRELHELSPLWVQIRRRLTAARELAEQMIQHPFFNDTSESAGCKAVQTTLRRKIRVLEDHINRCNELAEQTNVLISLIYNTATLQETKAANSFAASIRRVTMLTFIYLPLSLASSIFGMNITQISDGSGSPLWAYFALAIALMAATFGGCFIWSRILSGMKMRERRLLARRQHRTHIAASSDSLRSISSGETSVQSEKVSMGLKSHDMV